MVFGIFTDLRTPMYAEYELCHEYFSRNFLKFFRTDFSKNTTAGRTVLISCNWFLKIPISPFNPLTPCGNRRRYIVKQTSKHDLQVCLSMYGICKYVTPVMKG